jgi:predicted nucleic acid-binding protein
MPIASVVVDTNVIVAGLRSRRGSSARVLELVGRGLIEINLSVPVVLEYEAVLKRPGMVPASAAAIDELVDALCAMGQPRPLFFLWRPQLSDPSDEAILELAVAAGGVPIVTWNERHFRGAERFGVGVKTPLALLRDIGALP